MKQFPRELIEGFWIFLRTFAMAMALVFGTCALGESIWWEFIRKDLSRSDHAAIDACLLFVGYLILRERTK